MIIVSEKPVSIIQVQELLEERKQDGELSFEQQNALDYAKKFSKLGVKEAKKLQGELEKIEGATEMQIVKLIDLMPKKEDEVKAILQQDKKSSLSLDKAKEIAEILSNFK